ncbi:MAG TPA: DUF2064 domain-containing protein [Patescibacteria group bacterium]|nr:DUF2064 domain-containing protein [Patescibacteria group bacterium]
MTASGTRPIRCVLLFSRSTREEIAAKRLPGCAPLFELSRRRVIEAVASLPGVDLFTPRQRGSGFGQRLLNALLDARELGYREIVAVPADTPALDRARLVEAFAALESHSTALGRAADGGVYLIGVTARADPARLLSGVRWRTAGVFGDLVSNAPGAAVLDAELADIDHRQDLVAMSARDDLDARLAALILALLWRPVLPRPGAERRAESRRHAIRLTDRSPPGASASI